MPAPAALAAPFVSRFTGRRGAKWEDVILLSGFEGADGASVFVDESSYARSLEVSSTQTITSTTRQKFGASAIYNPAGGSTRLSVTSGGTDFNLPAGTDFTVESWLNCDSMGLTVFRSAWGRWIDTGDYTLWFRNTPTAVLFGAKGLGAAGADIGLQGGTPVNDTWHHVAVTRAGDVCRLFLDGAVVDEEAGWGGLALGNGIWHINNNGAAQDSFNGWQDELRFIKGHALYTGAFTPPTAAFPRGSI